MLSNLYIENLAVIEKVSIDFTNGLNVFTGETGAGKSIVIDAINAIIGSRFNKDIIRNGKEKATVIARFINLPNIAISIAKKYDIDIENDEIIIKREFSSDGKSSAKINSIPITISALREIGNVLVNIHGQHDNQILLSKEKHIDILDNLASINDKLAEFKEHFDNLSKIKLELSQIELQQQTKYERLNSLNEDIKEIEDAELEINEDVLLEKESRLIKNSAMVLENLKQAHDLLSGDEDEMGALDKISMALPSLEKASQYFEDLDDTIEKLNNILYETQSISKEIEKNLSSLDFNASKLDIIESRLNEIFKLKRKYGSSVEDILNALKNLKDEVDKIEMYDVRLNELILCQKKEEKYLDNLAKEISNIRHETASRFRQDVKAELSFLDMKGVDFEIDISPCERTSKGDEQVEFLISANVGELKKSIAKTASGGELSRIMLSIKNVLAEKDEISTLIFDEVDQGVSGSAAQKIGLKLVEVSKNKQVLAVTHLPQIAALANTHFKISKLQDKGRTYTHVDLLNDDDRVLEIARIISTGEITDLIKETAREMILSGKNL